MNLQPVMVQMSRSLGYNEGVLEGIGAFARSRGNWIVSLSGDHSVREADSQFKQWHPSGVIAHTASPKLIDLCRKHGIPLVEVAPRAVGNIPAVSYDGRKTGRLVAEYLVGRRHRHFAFLPSPKMRGRADSRVGFGEYLAEHGHHVIDFRADGIKSGTAAYRRVLARWLKELPKPVGLMAADDDRGLTACQRAVEAEVRVPEELAIVGVNNNMAICMMATPALTSVRIPTVRIGYEAASLLARLIAGKPKPEKQILLLPEGIETRGSSDALAVDDPKVREAVRYLRQHADRALGIDVVAEALAMSRSSLEKRFKTAMGRTPFAELRRQQIERIKRLLIDTDLTLEQLCEDSPFASAVHLSMAFRKVEGIPPSEFRNRHRRPGQSVGAGR